MLAVRHRVTVTFVNAPGAGAPDGGVGRDPPDQERLGELPGEQAALRRVATLVAQGVPPVEIFSAVSDEVAGLFGAQAGVLRFEHDGPAVVFVGVSKTFDLPVGTRWEFQPGMASAEVYRTGCSARIDALDWSSASGPVAAAARRLGIVSNVGRPIVVEGRLWGAMVVASTDELLPVGTGGRLEKFTGLVATAIANAESRSELAASRRRIVAASDEARRRIERDLHDGTQQRLVSLGLAARTAEPAAVDPRRRRRRGRSRARFRPCRSRRPRRGPGRLDPPRQRCRGRDAYHSGSSTGA